LEPILNYFQIFFLFGARSPMHGIIEHNYASWTRGSSPVIPDHMRVGNCILQ